MIRYQGNKIDFNYSPSRHIAYMPFKKSEIFCKRKSTDEYYAILCNTMHKIEEISQGIMNEKHKKALQLFICDFIYGVPTDYGIEEQYDEWMLRDMMRLIYKNKSASKYVLSYFIDDLKYAINKNQIYLSTRTANNCHSTVKFKVEELRNHFHQQGMTALYSPYEDLHQKVCSLSFYQFMKVRLRNLLESEYYVLHENTEESAFETLFVELLNIKLIEL